MNLVKRNLLFTLFLVATSSFSQEIPPIQVFTPRDYNADDQNWSISQDENDIIYVANNKGLLEYNGEKWNLYTTPNKTILRSVEVIDGIIYTGNYMDFGYWKRNEFGLLDYTSLAVNIENGLIEDEEIWEITELENWVLFQSFDRIYIYNTIDKDFKIVKSQTRINKMFKVDDGIYFQKINKGIFKIANGKDELLTSNFNIRDKEVVNIFSNDGELLFETKEDGFYIFDGENIQKWNIDANELLSRVSVYNSIKLKDGSFVLGTISNGIIQLNSKGEVILRIDQPRGLSNNTVLSIFEDTFGDIWLGLDNGINNLSLNSPFKIYRDNEGILGTIYASAKTETNLYLGTNQGLFYRRLGADDKFQFIENTKGQVWSLQNIDNTLFCGHDKGTFIVKGNTASMISNEKGTWFVKEIEGNSNLLIQGNYRGLHILEKNSNTWLLRNKIEGFDISSRYFEFISTTELLMSHEYKGVYKLQLDTEYTNVITYNKLEIDKGISTSIIDYNNKLYYVYEDRIFRYDDKENKLKIDTLLGSLFKNKKFTSGKLINDKEANRLWSFSKDHLLYVEPSKLTNELKIKSVPLSTQMRKSKLGFENILHLDNDNYLLGTTEGLIVIDLNKVEDKTYSIVLNTVSYNSLHEEMTPLRLSEIAELRNKDRNIYFTYSVTGFNKFASPLYQYRLIGIYNEWSSWSTNSEILFENLSHGEYKFEVRAKVGGSLTENTLSFSFNIAKPWYLKPLAIVLYIIIFLLLIYLLYYFNRRYYKKQQQKLLAKKERELELEQFQNQRQIMEIKNYNLQLDIENKNRELGTATMNLVKRNELLNNIKEELSRTKSIDGIKGVIKLVNSNLNDTSDWKLFEEAFNNVDKDFMKKIKTLHPSITPNDLRLCAYLRLNLSSKEIAPLLNISHKSVEVKRYRLRKKMGLNHDQSLSNYIIDL
ncbi:triple tyrosine motif-containing protein [uncultured Winogradskyella sp.]|uniref:triple tyrosine motif-containing protein n=1 Tax=uncultured Winogradskyella sp. TaxID=395353 RepID=UPI0026389B2E|nr:triple tyrosine motif-containing protein [uncultured Winogradskyella sp.]